MSHINESCHIGKRHITWEWVMSHGNESYHISTSHVTMSHVTYQRVMSHINKSSCILWLVYMWHFESCHISTTHCNTLQHTATHGNTRQHTATQTRRQCLSWKFTHNTLHLPRCNTLQHAATHCNTLQHRHGGNVSLENSPAKHYTNRAGPQQQRMCPFHSSSRCTHYGGNAFYRTRYSLVFFSHSSIVCLFIHRAGPQQQHLRWFHMGMSHVTWEWVMSHGNESCRVMSALISQPLPSHTLWREPFQLLLYNIIFLFFLYQLRWTSASAATPVSVSQPLPLHILLGLMYST